jgi:hypothetical protein
MKGKVALFQCHKTKIDITDVASGEVVQQYDVEGAIGSSASVQKNVAAVAVSEPEPGVHVMDIKTGQVVSKFIITKGHGARIALSKDALTLVVGTDKGMWL